MTTTLHRLRPSVSLPVRVRAAFAWALAGLLLVAGCSGGGMSTVGIAPVLPTTYTPGQVVTLDAGETLPVKGSVVNDPTGAGARFSLSGPGTLGAAAGTPVASSEQYALSYTAPASATAGSTATLTITSVATPAATASFTVTLNPALAITTTTLATGKVSTAYSATLASTGGTGALTWSVTAGKLPAGLSLSAAGVLSGTPSVAGSFSFTASVTDGASLPETVAQSYTLTVLPAITTGSLPNAVAGIAYSQTVQYTGGAGGVFTLAAGALPAGLTLSAAGVISGTPASSAAGTTANFSVTVTLGPGSFATAALSITVDALPTITTASLPNGNVTVPYSQQLNYTGGAGGAASWAVVSGALPAGLTLTSSGVLAGTPTTVGSSTFSVAVTVAVPGTSSSQTSAAMAYTVVINNLIITSSATATGEVGLPFAFQLTAAGGTPPDSWQVVSGSLPTGLSLSGSTGLITGTPTTSGTFSNVSVQATDQVGNTSTLAMTFVISAARGASSNNNPAFSGQYAFLLKGFDATGHPLALAGELTADGNGHITAGVVDVNGTGLTAATLNSQLGQSTYAVGAADNRGQLSLIFGGNTYHFVFALNGVTGGVASGGYMTEFDSTGQSLTGTLALQSSADFTLAAVSGGYAFGLEGYAAGSSASSLTRRAIIGETQFNGGATAASSEMLATSAGAAAVLTPSVTVSLGANGRGTLGYTYKLGSATTTLDFVFYIVAGNGKLYVLSSDAAGSTAGKDLLSGQEIQQTVATGSFAATTLSGTAVVRTERLFVNSANTLVADAQVGLLSFSGAGKIALASDENSGGAISSDALSGTYTVASNGRTAYSLAAGLGGCTDCVSPQSYMYLIGQNQGFVMDFATQPNFGYFENQTATGITVSTLSGSYAAGTQSPLLAGVADVSAALVSNGAGAITGTADIDASGTLLPDTAESAGYTMSTTGRAALTTTGNGEVLYVISPTKALLLDLTSGSPVVQEILHQ